MDKKESDGKVYRVYKSRDSHVNAKVNENGRKAAIQFGDKNNRLNGPVEIEEVDIDEIIACRTPQEMNPYIKLVLDEIVAPIIRLMFEVGTDKLICYLSMKGIPSVKQAIKEFSKSKKIYVEGIKDGLAGKELKANRLLREAEENRSSLTVTKRDNVQEVEDEYRRPEDIQKVIDILRKSVLVTATCIRVLTNMITSDDGTNPQKVEAYHCRQLKAAVVKLPNITAK